MSLSEFCFSSVESGLLVKGGSDDDGAASAVSCSPDSRPSPAAEAAATPAAAAPSARNLRRFRYSLRSVISDDGMSTGLPISMSASALPASQPDSPAPERALPLLVLDTAAPQ